MSLDQDFTDWANADPPKLKAKIATDIAKTVNEQFALKDRIEQGVQNSFQQTGQAIKELMGTVADGIESTLACCCKTEQLLGEKIRDYIQAKFSVMQAVQGFLDGKIAKIEKRLAKSAGKDKIVDADATPGAGGQGPRIPTPTSSATGFQPGGGNIPPPSFNPNKQPFGVPPTVEQITNIYFVTQGEGGLIPLVSLPQDWWNYQNQNGFWLSTENTIATRGSIPGYAPQGDTFAPVTNLYFNSSMPFGTEDIASLLQGLGLRPDGVQILNEQQAWDLAVRDFPPILVGQAWDSWGLPHPPAVLTTVPPTGQRPTVNMADLDGSDLGNGPGNADARPGTAQEWPANGENGPLPPSGGFPGPSTQQEGFGGFNAVYGGNPPPQTPDQFTSFPNPFAAGGGAAAAQIGPQSAANLVAWFAGLTRLDVCRLIGPAAPYVGMPAGVMPGCMTFEELSRYYSQWVRTAIGET